MPLIAFSLFKVLLALGLACFVALSLSMLLLLLTLALELGRVCGGNKEHLVQRIVGRMVLLL